MNRKHHISRLFHARIKKSVPPRATQQQGSTTVKLAAAAGSALLLLSGCGAPSNSLAAVAHGATNSATATPSPSPTPTPIAKTPCSTVESQRASGGATYICTADEAGKLMWLEQSESKKLSGKIAAAAAAKAAAEKAAADKATADAAAAEAAAKAAAEAKAAEEAAAAQAAAAAAAAKAAPAPAPAPAPPAPKYVAPAAPAAPSGCDPNYSGCVPVASDVDCAGGSGNGPAYVQGPVRVLGSDIYDLDRDSDGIGCEG